MSGLRIGITIGLHHAAETLWNNGIKQNAVFLAEALRHCPRVSGVMLVNTTAVPVTDALPWDLERYPTMTFDAAKDAVDVMIELGGQIDHEQTACLKVRGIRLISYCCGFEYVHAMESILFSKSLWGEHLFVNQRYDDIWIIPQVDHISRAYFEVLRRVPARQVPFVWSPMFVEARSRDLPESGRYRPGSGPKRLSVLEPNINVVKFALYPILIAELVYRRRPDQIRLLQVTNAERLAHESTEFVLLMNQLDIVRDGHAVFLGRYDTPEFLANQTDIVISHQWENPLNYLYLEVCWQGYPLVHNASLCPDLGYYYDGNDVEAGARRALEVLDVHDAQVSWYRERQRALIAAYLPHDGTLVAIYDALLDDLLNRPVR
jgi:hypothetical protein